MTTFQKMTWTPMTSKKWMADVRRPTPKADAMRKRLAAAKKGE